MADRQSRSSHANSQLNERGGQQLRCALAQLSKAFARVQHDVHENEDALAPRQSHRAQPEFSVTQGPVQRPVSVLGHVGYQS